MDLKRDYYKKTLPLEEQIIYESILKHIGKLALHGHLELTGLRAEQTRLNKVANAYMALRCDRPEFYFLANKIEIKSSITGVIEIRQERYYSYPQIKHINTLLIKELKNMLEQTKNPDVLVREKKIYQYITSTYQYKEGKNSHDVSGLIIHKGGVCEAISGLLVLALREAQIPAIKIHGKAKNENHCWVKVWIKGQPYHLDATWDLSFFYPFALFRYFNVTEDVILKDHKIYAPVFYMK